MVANNLRNSCIKADGPNLISRLLSWWKRRQGAKSSNVGLEHDGETGSGDDRQRLMEGNGDLRSTSGSKTSFKTSKRSADARPESSASSASSVLPPGEERSVGSITPRIQRLPSIIGLLMRPFKWRKETDEYKSASTNKASKKQWGSRKTRRPREHMPMTASWSPFDFGFTYPVIYPYPKASTIHYPYWHNKEWYWPIGRQSVMRVPKIVVIAPSAEAKGADARRMNRRPPKKPQEPERLHIRWQSRDSHWEAISARKTDLYRMELKRLSLEQKSQSTKRV